jgi:hypothetical protein
MEPGKCKALARATGKQCRRDAVQGHDFCTGHLKTEMKYGPGFIDRIDTVNVVERDDADLLVPVVIEAYGNLPRASVEAFVRCSEEFDAFYRSTLMSTFSVQTDLHNIFASDPDKVLRGFRYIFDAVRDFTDRAATWSDSDVAHVFREYLRASEDLFVCLNVEIFGETAQMARNVAKKSSRNRRPDSFLACAETFSQKLRDLRPKPSLASRAVQIVRSGLLALLLFVIRRLQHAYVMAVFYAMVSHLQVHHAIPYAKYFLPASRLDGAAFDLELKVKVIVGKLQEWFGISAEQSIPVLTFASHQIDRELMNYQGTVELQMIPQLRRLKASTVLSNVYLKPFETAAWFLTAMETMPGKLLKNVAQGRSIVPVNVNKFGLFLLAWTLMSYVVFRMSPLELAGTQVQKVVSGILKVGRMSFRTTLPVAQRFPRTLENIRNSKKNLQRL